MLTETTRAQLVQQYQKAIDSIDDDPPTALLGFRKVAETICFSVFESGQSGQVYSFPIQHILRYLIEKKALPDLIFLHIQLVLQLTDSETISDSSSQHAMFVTPCASSTAVLFRWYVNEN